VRAVSAWPVPGGLLERLGQPPAEIEARSRQVARRLVGDRWHGEEAGLAASLLYAAGDAGLLDELRLGGDPVRSARAALAAGAGLLVDVTMVASGLRLPEGSGPAAVAVRQPGAEELARRAGTTRAAAGVERAWDGFGAGGVVVIGNAPTALLAALDLAATRGAPVCVVATCPGFHVAAEAKAELAASGLPYVTVMGPRGGSGLAVAAANFLLAAAR
jgi:precorrin-8X/cobalt-precorrin-8 methylmutase